MGNEVVVRLPRTELLGGCGWSILEADGDGDDEDCGMSAKCQSAGGKQKPLTSDDDAGSANPSDPADAAKGLDA